MRERRKSQVLSWRSGLVQQVRHQLLESNADSVLGQRLANPFARGEEPPARRLGDAIGYRCGSGRGLGDSPVK